MTSCRKCESQLGCQEQVNDYSVCFNCWSGKKCNNCEDLLIPGEDLMCDACTDDDVKRSLDLYVDQLLEFEDLSEEGYVDQMMSFYDLENMISS